MKSKVAHTIENDTTEPTLRDLMTEIKSLSERVPVDLKEQLIEIKADIKTNSEDIDKLAQMMAIGFEKHDKKFEITDARLDTIEKILPTLATKADILALHDKFVPRSDFDKLSLRVSVVEEKVA